MHIYGHWHIIMYIWHIWHNVYLKSLYYYIYFALILLTLSITWTFLCWNVNTSLPGSWFIRPQAICTVNVFYVKQYLIGVDVCAVVLKWSRGTYSCPLPMGWIIPDTSVIIITYNYLQITLHVTYMYKLRVWVIYNTEIFAL